MIKGDPRQLKQLFQNLISNAIKYHKKDLAPHIQIRAKAADSEELKSYNLPDEKRETYIEIDVQDNGIGFAQEDSKRIFALFQRLHGKAEYEGTGVGLAIVQKVVENHHGCIKAESAPGEGALFRILLPVG
jgi:signal transduction histidine kinase